ncbi:hypothetical protein K445DRAFT_314425 [Daldinia sp. EC12]|nr:hypothetical protein K445DRAFT_314425 [Daldinia sp. EC12]
MFGKTRIPPYNPAANDVVRRQYVEENGRYVWFWYTRTGVIVKWSLFLGILLLLMLYLVLGRMHARKRIRAGMKPMAYHGGFFPVKKEAPSIPNMLGPKRPTQHINREPVMEPLATACTPFLLPSTTPTTDPRCTKEVRPRWEVLKLTQFRPA